MGPRTLEIKGLKPFKHRVLKPETGNQKSEELGFRTLTEITRIRKTGGESVIVESILARKGSINLRIELGTLDRRSSRTTTEVERTRDVVAKSRAGSWRAGRRFNGNEGEIDGKRSEIGTEKNRRRWVGEERNEEGSRRLSVFREIKTQKENIRYRETGG